MAEIYRNRKGFFSINVQTLCDADLKILDIVARWPGSAHDSLIFRNSKVRAQFESGKFRDSYIVGDSGYENSDFLMTPLGSVRSEAENLYNESIIRTRNCIERSYGVWKRRFPILSLGVRLQFQKLQGIIVATAVLHNICCINNESEPPQLSEEIQNEVDFVLAVPHYREARNTNNSVRQKLINEYFQQLL